MAQASASHNEEPCTSTFAYRPRREDRINGFFLENPTSRSSHIEGWHRGYHPVMKKVVDAAVRAAETQDLLDGDVCRRSRARYTAERLAADETLAASREFVVSIRARSPRGGWAFAPSTWRCGGSWTCTCLRRCATSKCRARSSSRKDRHGDPAGRRTSTRISGRRRRTAQKVVKF